eukprot:CAMPEP_0195032738 /NCGR_PEP_ID=MMETSP0326_2-20130528/64167_1 /TAXON_ID=2866 ORGANISM="Crypthecodinium cohnii, Strain Seligo" /NCGR_SAMPLE_ID=MMETSP0326_2 /ASSEMBLY_ACC=CAM_ASM_000348 /LENGTH=40 /DNA_ID= /DNA_START= /DNA_END= /DNA_ORIENTATION=
MAYIVASMPSGHRCEMRTTPGMMIHMKAMLVAAHPESTKM